MAYTGEISRDHPTCFLFVIDQSSSMEERMGSGRSKADFVADVLNKTLSTLVINCTKADGVRSYFDIGVIAYGGAGVTAGFGGLMGGGLIQSINIIAERPLRVEERAKKTDDGAGGIVDQKIKFPVWFDATSSGGTFVQRSVQHFANLRSQIIFRCVAAQTAGLTRIGRTRHINVVRFVA